MDSRLLGSDCPGSTRKLWSCRVDFLPAPRAHLRTARTCTSNMAWSLPPVVKPQSNGLGFTPDFACDTMLLRHHVRTRGALLWPGDLPDLKVREWGFLALGFILYLIRKLRTRISYIRCRMRVESSLRLPSVSFGSFSRLSSSVVSRGVLGGGRRGGRVPIQRTHQSEKDISQTHSHSTQPRPFEYRAPAGYNPALSKVTTLPGGQVYDLAIALSAAQPATEA